VRVVSKEGFYQIRYAGPAGQGFGIAVLDSGLVVGVDMVGGRYDGTYKYNQTTDQLDLEVTVWVPPGVWLVQGVPAQSEPHIFKASASISRNWTGEQTFTGDTEFGQVVFWLSKLRDFPT
jgi:hypothetical protein